MSFDSSLIEWHHDGHYVTFTLGMSEIQALPEPCPYTIIDNPCRVNGICLFVHYVSIYGMELNVGSVPINGPIEFAWALQGDARDLDAAQLWIIPVEDATFAPWLASFDV